MKYTKVFNGNQYVTKFYVGHLTKWQRFVRSFTKGVKRSVVILGCILVILIAFYEGTSTKISEIIMVQSTSTPAVMSRIAKCESGNNQLDKNGQTLIHMNTNGTYDIGAYQINSIWEAQATKLGYNLMNKEDNQAFAYWLYNNKGTQDWSASQKCWQ